MAAAGPLVHGLHILHGQPGGRVLEALRSTGHADNTIIVLWSDNGWHLGEKLITGKNSLWERSTHVPLIFAGPGSRGASVQARRNYGHLSDACRFMPTGSPAGFGRSFASAAIEKRLRPTEWPAITTSNQNNHSIRTERGDTSIMPMGRRTLRPSQDPDERKNLANDPHSPKRSANWPSGCRA